MTLIQEANIVQIISGDATVSLLVGDRIYPGALPENPTLPAVTYSLASSPRSLTQQGASLTRPRYRWSCWALMYDQTVLVAIAVAKASRAFRAWVDNEMDDHEAITGLFCRRLETLAWMDPEEA